MTDTIKVRVVMTVEVSRSSWRVNYGSEADHDNEVRAYVREIAESAVQDQLARQGVTATVSTEGVSK